MTEAGPIAEAEVCLRDTLADCAHFRTLVQASGSGAQEQARNRIHYDLLRERRAGDQYGELELNELIPYALVGTLPGDEGASGDAVSTGSAGFNFVHSGGRGKLWLVVCHEAPKDVPEYEVNRRGKEVIDQIISDLEGLAGTGGYLAMLHWLLLERMRTDPDNVEIMGDNLMSVLHLTY